jgi:hypothetical protein
MRSTDAPGHSSTQETTVNARGMRKGRFAMTFFMAVKRPKMTALGHSISIFALLHLD